MNSDQLVFSASGTGTTTLHNQEHNTKWTYSLGLYHDKKATLYFILETEMPSSNPKIENYEYNSDLKIEFSNSICKMIFMDTTKTGRLDGVLISPEKYTKSLFASIDENGDCTLYKDEWQIKLKEVSYNTCSSKSFISAHYITAFAPTSLEEAEKELELINQTPRRSGYVSCHICGRYDVDAGGIDYWEWNGKVYCYGGCWTKKVNEATELVNSFKK